MNSPDLKKGGMMDDAMHAIQMIHDAISRRDRPFPERPWWRSKNRPPCSTREMDIGEHMYAKGAKFVLREWEMHERRRMHREMQAAPDPFDVEPSREPEDG